MNTRLLTLPACVLFVAGCATPQSQWTPAVDTYGNSRAQYLTRDMEECRAIATSSSGSVQDETARGAGIGALGGAAAGFLVGSAFGRAGEGAVAGAALGATGGAAVQGTRTRAQFEEAFRNCLRGRGHNVVG